MIASVSHEKRMKEKLKKIISIAGSFVVFLIAVGITSMVMVHYFAPQLKVLDDKALNASQDLAVALHVRNPGTFTTEDYSLTVPASLTEKDETFSGYTTHVFFKDGKVALTTFQVKNAEGQSLNTYNICGEDSPRKTTDINGQDFRVTLCGYPVFDFESGWGDVSPTFMEYDTVTKGNLYTIAFYGDLLTKEEQELVLDTLKFR
jgi:hypothetical protein